MTKRKKLPPGILLAVNPCGAPIRTHMDGCGRPGYERYSGRCRAHRPISPEERAALAAEKKAARIAYHKLEEELYADQLRQADLASARDHFTSAALFFGLASRETAVTFERFQRLSNEQVLRTDRVKSLYSASKGAK